ncbi:MAG: hypothetical protein DRI61_09535 [Chloroflexi bacterium]|nr:MAG: hypothetical protein DRI61_09535 [Chloroflexota bacterium]HDN80439.1 hypothetical protein [Chloroflexota bacterium]
MRYKLKELVQELERLVKESFPEAIIEGCWERGEKSVALCVEIPPSQDLYEFVEKMAPWSIETLERTGYLVYVLPNQRDSSVNS